MCSLGSSSIRYGLTNQLIAVSHWQDITCLCYTSGPLYMLPSEWHEASLLRIFSQFRKEVSKFLAISDIMLPGLYQPPSELENVV
jgi:hypothetical protein